MSVFVRASLEGTPKTSPGHVALHHMPGLPMNLQSLPPQQRPNAARAQASDATPPRPNIATGFTSNPNAARAQARAARAQAIPLNVPGQARFML